MIGQEFRQYRVLEKLGAGGMGEVYLAEDTSLGRRVALKLLPPEHTTDPERLRRFRIEVRSASALNHPHILTVHEVGEVDGRQFMATEYVDGETLRTILSRSGKMTPRETLDVGVQAASALAAAHDAGIVHRDIKPENIMIRRDGYVKVLDFGLAKLTGTETAESFDTGAATLPPPVHTDAGAILGTTPYMSPEQAAGRPVDARSDIFSFGAVLYEMVSGQRPFRGGSTMETIAAILDRDPAPLPASVPPALAAAILRCLRKDPSRRFQSMADLRATLEDLRENAGTPRGSWRFTIVAASLVLLLAAGFLIWEFWRKRGTPDPLRADVLTTLSGAELYPSLSPDGNHVVFAWAGPGQDNQDIYVQLIGSGSPLRLTTDAQQDYNPVWSPDGRWIAFFRGPAPAPTGRRRRELRVIPPLGGPERKIAEVRGQDFFPAASFLAWSSDSRTLLVTDSQEEGKPDALFAIDVETGEKRQLTEPPAGSVADTSPAISPDGRSLVFLRRTSWAAGELHLLPLEEGMRAAGAPRRLTGAALRADFPAWMPDGREIVFSAQGKLWKLDVREGQEPVQIPFVGENGVMPAIGSRRPGGEARLVYVRSFADTNIWRVETPAAGQPARTLPELAISSSKVEYHVQFSPDGQKVAFVSERSGAPEIWVAHADGSDAFQLTSLKVFDTNCPHWSPDGRTIAFSSTAPGEFDLYTIPSAGGPPRRLTNHPSIDICPTYSRDGRWIYFTSMRSGDYGVWKMPAAGGEAVVAASGPGGRALEAADGGSVYYLNVSVVSPLWRVPSSGGQPVKALDGVLWFNFWPAGDGVYYIDRLGRETRLRYLHAATGESSTVATNLGEVTAGLTASPDGKTVLFTRLDAYEEDLMLVENFR
jgi:serine/threonine protein kinase/Tol biopolymer transport system component